MYKRATPVSSCHPHTVINVQPVNKPNAIPFDLEIELPPKHLEHDPVDAHVCPGVRRSFTRRQRSYRGNAQVHSVLQGASLPVNDLPVLDLQASVVSGSSHN